MIQSMTGYGKIAFTTSEEKITLEIKTLNSKNLDIHTKIPIHYNEKELEMKKRISEKMIRGKVEFSMICESLKNSEKNQINEKLLKKYYENLKRFYFENVKWYERSIWKLYFLKMAVQFPNVIENQSPQENLEDLDWEKINEALENVLETVVNYRKKEGAALENDFKIHMKTLENLNEEIEVLEKERSEYLKKRLENSVKCLQEKVDLNRFEQEILYYMEKMDISEEKMRLKNHLHYFLEVLEKETAQGKKLGFIVQEMGREINTLSAKANFAPMQKIVVKMKDTLEKIKEQIANIV